jgi:hypothetical protein
LIYLFFLSKIEIKSEYINSLQNYCSDLKALTPTSSNRRKPKILEKTPPKSIGISLNKSYKFFGFAIVVRSFRGATVHQQTKP